MDDFSLSAGASVNRMNLARIIQGSLLGHVLHFLHVQNYLSYFDDEVGRSAVQHAHELRIDCKMYVALLEFVARSSDVLLPVPVDAELAIYDHDTFRLNPQYSKYGSMGHFLDKFFGAYGPQLHNLCDVLRNPRAAHALTDSDALCTAFSRVGEDCIDSHIHPLFHFMDLSHNSGGLLDLGCGPGTLLLEAAQRMNPHAQHWGVDLSSAMCRSGRQRVEEAGLTDSISIIEGNVRSLSELLPETAFATETISAIHCGSIVNEFVWAEEEAISFLAEIRALFPTTMVFVTDYYGILGKETGDVSEGDRVTLSMLHDVIQAVSGQGVPPKSVGDWKVLYEAAGYLLKDYYEYPVGRSFIHVLLPT